ncbi:MAG: PIN domain-containing protein [Candidatus Margulisbacteria bacterium]|nr:PIN domain-containing protein [Candidatus Margulisiibacteriota bacterium]
MTLKPRIYLETTIFNYYFLEDSGRKEDIIATKRLFEEIKLQNFEAYVSALTIAELERCPDPAKKTKMLSLIESYNLLRINFESPVLYEELAGKYILAGAIPESKRGDALHIAIATVAKMDILASWNCNHIVRFRTQELVRAINLSNNYTDLAINTPKEVVGT